MTHPTAHPGLFHPLTSAQILKTTEANQPIPWIWHRWIAEGHLAVFSSSPKIGKSTLIYELALAVSRGEDYLGYRTRKGRVLILAVEEHPRDVVQRLERLGLRATDKIRLWPRSLSRDMLPRVKAYIEANHIRLVIVDTLAKFWSSYLVSDNENAEVIRALEPLMDLARQTNAAVLCIHHDRKGGGEDGESIRGAGSLRGEADQVLLLRKVANHETQRKLITEGRRDETPRSLLVDYVPNGRPPVVDKYGHTTILRHYISLGTPQATDPATHTARVVSALGTGSKTIKQLIELTHTTRKPLDALMKRLLAKKLVTRTGTGLKGSPHVYTLMKPSNGGQG
jgi:hypothetical protein